MDYRRADDELFGKYCYIDTPWIAGKKTIYRIIRSGVRSNAWCEVPVNGLTKKVNHGEHSEEIVFVVLDTLIDEHTEIMRFALKDVEIITADRKTEPQTVDWKDEMWTEAVKDEPQTCSFSDCNNFKNPDYERCIECKRKQIKLKTEQTEREGE